MTTSSKHRVRREYVDLDHGQVHIRVVRPRTPTHPPLVCLHMSPASGLVYENLLASLGTDRVAVAMDTPGFGASDPLPAHPSIGDYADAVAEVIAAMDLAVPVDLLGYHTGSLTSIELANRRPELVHRIVAVSMPVFTDDELAHLRQVYSKDPVFTENGERLLERWRWFVDFFRVGTDNTVEDAARVFVARLSGGERHWWGHHAAFAYDVRGGLEALDKPILVINLDDDLAVQTRRSGELLREGQLLEVPQWTHGFLDAHTEEAASLICDFLDTRP